MGQQSFNIVAFLRGLLSLEGNFMVGSITQLAYCGITRLSQQFVFKKPRYILLV